ncbi:hypothetical protein [Vulcanisaeta thermophila]|nr:hypothetical protein [Vulcanisaeta thermophila]
MGRIGRLYPLRDYYVGKPRIGRLYPAHLHPWVVEVGSEGEVKDSAQEQ